MDGREAPSYYLNRGVSGLGPLRGSGTQTGLVVPSPSFKPESSPNISSHSNIRFNPPSFQVENPSPNFLHGINMGIASDVSPSSESVKRKRGRPRKYGPDGSHMSLKLSTASLDASPGSLMPTPKKSRGRPPGSGWKQRLASLGEWMNSSAGLAFTPHVIHISVGEDVAAKVLSFAQQRPRALCILSGNGAVSSVTLRQPASSAEDTVAYEGRFEILCLSGSYLLAESGGTHNRTGGLSISVCAPDGQVIGGAIGGRLIAASLVQVVLCSFVYGGGGSKTKIKTETGSKESHNSAMVYDEKSYLQTGAAPSSRSATQSMGPVPWPSDSRSDMRNLHTGIDLTRG